MAKKLKQKKRRNTKFLWAILVLALFPLGFNAMSATMTKRYTAEMRMMVEESSSSPIVPPGPFYNIDDYQLATRPRSAQTQLDALTGTTVIENAYQLASDRMPDKVAKSENKAQIYDDLVRRLSVDNEPTSEVLSVRVTEDDPTVAAELANDVGLAYIEYMKKTQRDSASLMTDQIKDQVAPILSKLKSIDSQIRSLKEKYNIYDLGTVEANLGATKEADDRTLANAMAQYDGAKAQLAVAEVQMKQIPLNIDAGSHIQLNPVLVSLQTALATENVNLAQLKAQYQDSFPQVKEEEQKIADLRSQLQQVKQSVPSGQDRSINPLYQSAQSNLAALRAQVQAYAKEFADAQQEQLRSESQVSRLPEAEQQLQALIRDRTTYEQTYEQLAQRETTAIHSMEIQRAPATIVSPALPPSGPSYPDHKMLSLTGLALGIFFAVLILMPRPQIVTELPEEQVPLEPERVATVESPLLESPGKENGGAHALAEALKKAQTLKTVSDDKSEPPSLSGSPSSA